jgi:hypothetical protein
MFVRTLSDPRKSQTTCVLTDDEWQGLNGIADSLGRYLRQCCLQDSPAEEEGR